LTNGESNLPFPGHSSPQHVGGVPGQVCDCALLPATLFPWEIFEEGMAQTKKVSSLLFAAALAGLLTEMFYGIIVPILPELRTTYGVDPSRIGLLLSAQAFAMAVLAVPLGWLGDRLHQRWPLVALGMLLLSLSSLLVGESSSFNTLVVARLLQGSAAAALLPSILAIVSEQVAPSHRGEALGWITGAEGLGSVVGPLIGGVLFRFLGLQQSFVVIALVLGVLSLPLALVFRRTRVEVLVAEYAVPLQLHPHRAGTAGVSLVVLALATSTMAILEVVGTLRLSDELQLGKFSLGLLFLVLGLIFAAVQPLVGRFSDSHDRWVPVIWGLMALVVLLFVAGVVSGWAFLAVILLMAPAVALVFAPVAPLVGDEAEVTHGYGRAYGIMHVAFAMGYIIGPVLGGELLKTGGPSLPMLVASAIAALTLAFLLVWLRVAPISTSSTPPLNPAVALALKPHDGQDLPAIPTVSGERAGGGDPIHSSYLPTRTILPKAGKSKANP
jgi:DHA1 family multidrug resistance protein-like MFS transporter